MRPRIADKCTGVFMRTLLVLTLFLPFFAHASDIRSVSLCWKSPYKEQLKRLDARFKNLQRDLADIRSLREDMDGVVAKSVWVEGTAKAGMAAFAGAAGFLTGGSALAYWGAAGSGVALSSSMAATALSERNPFQAELYDYNFRTKTSSFVLDRKWAHNPSVLEADVNEAFQAQRYAKEKLEEAIRTYQDREMPEKQSWYETGSASTRAARTVRDSHLARELMASNQLLHTMRMHQEVLWRCNPATANRDPAEINQDGVKAFQMRFSSEPETETAPASSGSAPAN